MSAQPLAFQPRTQGAVAAQATLWPALREAARGCDADGAFPGAAFECLREAGWLGDETVEGRGPILPLLRRLADVGRGDLSVGRIYEGHVNAVQLVVQHGDAAQRGGLREDLAKGRLFGVWNTDAPNNPLHLVEGPDGASLAGAKSFASGVDELHAAIVTVPVDEGRQMVLVKTAERPVDRAWWTPIGMKASGSHVIDLDGVLVTRAMRLGRPDAYVRQPWFSAGAIRFAAVQAGGLHALLDIVRDHLVGAGRAGDPYQTHRLADLALLVEGAYGWLERAARHWDAGCGPGAGEAQAAAAVAHANLTRIAIERAAMDGLQIVQRAVGCAGLVEPHPLSRAIRDLMVYLRQPNPDGALGGAGAAVAAGDFEAGAL